MIYGLIGEHLGHSFSAEIHAQLGEEPYELRELPPDQVEAFLRERDFRGINVTIPYKQTVIPFLDGISETARAIGAVNTVVQRDGKLYGDNTDAAGLTMLLRRTGAGISGKKVLILGTGGIGRVFKYTTNSAIATGDGITMAYHIGAKIKNLSYIQFHPTGFAPKDDSHERFLISEAVRGEGAVLRNVNGDRFVENYDYRGELAPRDVVSRIIIQEGQRLNSDKFYLDITHEDPDFVRSRFPMIYEKCLEEGIDMTKDWIPIYPTQHYLMGGINVDTKARTNVPGLYAVGECSHTGIHGKNRLASNSLLEALVFSRRAATDIILNICVNGCAKPKDEPVMPSKEGKPLRKGIRTTIRNILQEAHFVTLNTEKAAANMPVIEELLKEVYADDLAMSKDLIEARSAVTVAYIVLNEDIENAKNNN